MPEIETTKKMPITAKDPHHNGDVEWGWDGTHLWVRHWKVTQKWTIVKRIHPTRHRVRMLAELMSFSFEELKDMQNGKLAPFKA